MAEGREQRSFSFQVEGMTCSSCVRMVERGLTRTQGIDYVSVNLATEKGYVLADPSVDWETLEGAVQKSGYTLKKEPPRRDLVEERFRKARGQFLLALAVTLPLMGLMIAHMAGAEIPGFVWMELAGAGVVLFGSGWGTLRGAAIALAHRHANMDTLVSLGAISAWMTAGLHLAGLPILSFGSVGAMLIAFHLTGRYLEARLKRKAAGDIRALMDLQENTAFLLKDDGTLEEMPAESVKPGALLRVRAGETVPLDGEVSSGRGSVDESMVTGEPLPTQKEPGDEVIGGTILQGGSMDVRVTRVGDETFLSRMVKLIEEAQASRVPIQALADRITLYFVPAVFLLALLSGLVWLGLYGPLQGFLEAAAGVIPWVDPAMGAPSTAIFVFVAVLVIACPCALGLATPMALTAGSGTAARRGILIRNGEAVQAARGITTVCLDKTGTLTEGHPKVAASSVPRELLDPLAEMESRSAHPLGRGVVEFRDSQGGKPPGKGAEEELEEIEEIAGEGLRGVWRGDALFIGRPRDPSQYAEALEKGRIVLEVRRNGEPAGTLELTDPVKPGAAETVARLREEGLTPVMVTGDEEKTAWKVARETGIEEVHAGVKPEEKVQVVQALQQKGQTVAMTGDGINDAAALKAADLGIALGSGTDLSMESADVLLVTGDLIRIPELFDLSRRIFSAIRRNLFWAFFYNLAALPLAMAGLLHPVLAELAMTFSSVNVIIRSLRIRTAGDRGGTP